MAEFHIETEFLIKNFKKKLECTSVPVQALFVYSGWTEGEKGKSSSLIPASQIGNLKLCTLRNRFIQLWATGSFFGRHIRSNRSLLNICGSSGHSEFEVENAEVKNCEATCKLWSEKQKLLTNCEESWNWRRDFWSQPGYLFPSSPKHLGEWVGEGEAFVFTNIWIE